jgi:hypothetical protein
MFEQPFVMRVCVCVCILTRLLHLDVQKCPEQTDKNGAREFFFA